MSAGNPARRTKAIGMLEAMSLRIQKVRLFYNFTENSISQVRSLMCLRITLAVKAHILRLHTDVWN